ncbi:MAG: ABC transporter ATP-binding protein [Bacteroidota bacterium]
MIQTKALTKVYRTDEVKTTALNQIDIEIKKGEFVSIMGPSGCGKSTLLNILGMIDSPTSGEHHFLEYEVSGFTERQRSKVRKENIGFIFQSFNLIDELSVFENVELPLIYTKVGAKERKERVEAQLEKLGMMHRAKHFPQQLSGGQQQRVAVARAVINNPPLILADEPTGNLDSASGNDVMKTLVQLNDAGATIIMVTHSQYCAEFGDRIIRLLDGQVVTENAVSKQML